METNNPICQATSWLFVSATAYMYPCPRMYPTIGESTLRDWGWSKTSPIDGLVPDCRGSAAVCLVCTVCSRTIISHRRLHTIHSSSNHRMKTTNWTQPTRHTKPWVSEPQAVAQPISNLLRTYLPRERCCVDWADKRPFRPERGSFPLDHDGTHSFHISLTILKTSQLTCSVCRRMQALDTELPEMPQIAGRCE